MADVIGTTNKFLISLQGNSLLFMKPPVGKLSKEDALNIAAWLVALTFASDEDFLSYLNKVRNQ